MRQIIVQRLGLRPRPHWGAHSAPAEPHLVKGKGRGGEGREKEGGSEEGKVREGEVASS